MVKKKVVIVGGGFAGFRAAKKLENIYDVILIDEKDYFEYTPSILRVVVDPSHKNKIRIAYKKYLKSAIFRFEKVIEMDKRIVATSKNRYYYDFAVICTGSEYGALLADKSIVKAGNSKELMLSTAMLKKSGSVNIVGGGLVGVELAAEIIGKYPDKQVTIIHNMDSLIERNPSKARSYAFNFLKKKGVRVIFGEKVVLNKNNVCITENGLEYKADIVFSCIGISPRSGFLKKALANSMDNKSSIIVNSYLQLDGFPNVFAAGDITSILEEKLAQNAEKQGSIVAENIIRIQRKKPLKVYVPKKRAIVISLGRWNGILVYGKFVITGKIPGILKNFIEWFEMFKLRFF
jgi:apoptosis-inducing factor 2